MHSSRFRHFSWLLFLNFFILLRIIFFYLVCSFTLFFSVLIFCLGIYIISFMIYTCNSGLTYRRANGCIFPACCDGLPNASMFGTDPYSSSSDIENGSSDCEYDDCAYCGCTYFSSKDCCGICLNLDVCSCLCVFCCAGPFCNNCN